MNPPKVLPWLARKAGLTEEHVEMIWDSAIRHASLMQPQLAANQRMAVAMQELMARLSHEESKKIPRSFALNEADRFIATRAGAGMRVWGRIKRPGCNTNSDP